MNKMLSATLCAAMLMPGSGTSSAHANPITSLDRPPYDARAIGVEIDQQQLTGMLNGETLLALVEAGRVLFDAKFTTADGAGRPLATQAAIPTLFRHVREAQFQRASGPDANSCTSCHNDPIDGGAGDFAVNVFTSEGTESADFDNVDPEFSNERGTTHLFGAGLLELLAREMTGDLHSLRSAGLTRARESGQTASVDLVTKGVSFGTLLIAPDGTMQTAGVEGIDPDLIADLERQFGLDKPVHERFALMLWNYARFDFGDSFRRSESVINIKFEGPLDILYMGAGIAFVALAGYLGHKGGKH